VIKKFYLTLQQLNQTDKLLVHLNSFASNPMNFTMPDTVGKGLPLFTMTPGIATPVLYSQVSRDARYFWKELPLFTMTLGIATPLIYSQICRDAR
jgi:hypothetical protein